MIIYAIVENHLRFLQPTGHSLAVNKLTPCIILLYIQPSVFVFYICSLSHFFFFPLSRSPSKGLRWYCVSYASLGLACSARHIFGTKFIFPLWSLFNWLLSMSVSRRTSRRQNMVLAMVHQPWRNHSAIPSSGACWVLHLHLPLPFIFQVKSPSSH